MCPLVVTVCVVAAMAVSVGYLAHSVASGAEAGSFVAGVAALVWVLE